MRVIAILTAILIAANCGYANFVKRAKPVVEIRGMVETFSPTEVYIVQNPSSRSRISLRVTGKYIGAISKLNGKNDCR